MPGDTKLNIELGAGIYLTLVLIPRGKFMMGSPCTEIGRDSDEHQHEVTISRPFYMGVTHVTVRQFAKFVDDTRFTTDAERSGHLDALGIRNGNGYSKTIEGGNWRNPGIQQEPDHPVVAVSWNDAQAFCQWLSKKSGRAATLPTQAQWEYACRAGTTAAYIWGDDPNDGVGWANGADQSLAALLPNDPTSRLYFRWNDGFAFTSPVATFRPNAFGLYDMHGNVEQWCQDFCGEYGKQPVTDPTGPATGNLRALRGGSWADIPIYCRSAFHGGQFPTAASDILGFRVVINSA